MKNIVVVVVVGGRGGATTKTPAEQEEEEEELEPEETQKCNDYVDLPNGADDSRMLKRLRERRHGSTDF